MFDFKFRRSAQGTEPQCTCRRSQLCALLIAIGMLLGAVGTFLKGLGGLLNGTAVLLHGVHAVIVSVEILIEDFYLFDAFFHIIVTISTLAGSGIV